MMRGAAGCVLAALLGGAPAVLALQPPSAGQAPAGQTEDAQTADQPPAEPDAGSETPAAPPADAAGESVPAPDVEPGDPDAATAAPEDAGGEADPEAPGGTFEAPAGLILSYITTEGGPDFERVLGRLGAALLASEDEERRALADGWRLYRAREPGPDGEVLYVWLIDPVAAGADYAVPALLGEVLPDESQELYDAFSAAFGAGQALINLEPVNLGGAPPQ